MGRQIRRQVSLFGADRAKTVLSVDHLVKLVQDGLPEQLHPCGANSSLEGPNPGKALPGFQLLRAPWLAGTGGQFTWFLSCGAMQVELSHPRWRLGSWGAVLDIWLDIPTEASAPPGASERLWAPGQPGAWLMVLAAGWLRAGTPRTRPGSGDPGPSCWTGHPPTPIRQLHPGPAHRPQGGLGGPVDGCRFPFLSGPHSLGYLRGLSLWHPEEESSMN